MIDRSQLGLSKLATSFIFENDAGGAGGLRKRRSSEVEAAEKIMFALFAC